MITQFLAALWLFGMALAIPAIIIQVATDSQGKKDEQIAAWKLHVKRATGYYLGAFACFTVAIICLLLICGGIVVLTNPGALK